MKLYLIPLLFWSTLASAKTHHAHIHGEAYMSLVYDSNVVAMTLQIPAFNILGFEDEPNNEKQKEQLAQALNDLKNLPDLFVLEPKCEVIETQIEMPFAELEHLASQHTNHHSHYTSHKKETSSIEKKRADHADFQLMYQWQCPPHARQLTISTSFFEAYKNIEKIRVEWLAFDRQGATVLNRKQPFLKFAP